MSLDQPSDSSHILVALEAVIAARKASPDANKSYVAKLLTGGLEAIGAKITEEAAEMIEAAAGPGVEGRDHLVREATDLIFHTLVLLGHRGVAWSEVEGELGRRFGVGGLVEKASREEG